MIEQITALPLHMMGAWLEWAVPIFNQYMAKLASKLFKSKLF